MTKLSNAQLNTMRNISLLIFALVSVSVPVFSQETGTTRNGKVLVALEESPSDPFVHSFYVSRSQLPSKVQWMPDKIFPVNLGTEAVRAKGFLMNGLQTNDFKLGFINISHAFAGPEWVVDFRFVPEPPALTNLFVEMLLDGTYAEEHVRSKTKSEALTDEQITHKLAGELTPPRQFIVTSGTNIFRPTPPIDARTNASDLVRLPGFVIPLVQWKWGESFPLDLSVGVAQAQACLAHPESFVLREIHVSRYFPDGAMGHSTEAFLNNLNHWLIDYYFNSSEEKAAYRVYMLLDGRILCVTAQNY